MGVRRHTGAFLLSARTKMAMEDASLAAIALSAEPSWAALALTSKISRMVRAPRGAQDNYGGSKAASVTGLPPLTLAMSLLSRSKRIGYEN